MRKYILSVILICLVFSCEEPIQNFPDFSIYHTRSDYSNNIFVTVNESKSQIIASPGVEDIDTLNLPVKLTKGFSLGRGKNGLIGVRSVATSLTIQSYKKELSLDSLFKLIIDFDPFIDYYQCKESKAKLFHNNSGFDTVLVNDIISKNELSEYFNKIK